MIDVGQKVKFTLTRLFNNNLYATNVKTENEEMIAAETKYEVPESREIANEEFVQGTVKFYNWRRGHGRILLQDETEGYYFHRNDVISNDKVPGVENGTTIICQVVNDPKGPAVTNIKNPDGTPLEKHTPNYRKN